MKGLAVISLCSALGRNGGNCSWHSVKVYRAAHLEFAVKSDGAVEPSGHYMYHQFNIQQFYVLPTQSIHVFCVDLRTNSDYFPRQH